MAVENQTVFNGKYSSNKEKRKVKRLKKYVNEILLLSGEDPSHPLDTANIETSNGRQTMKQNDIAMKVSRKLHCLREEVAPQPQIEFRTNGLRGSRLGSEHIAQLAHRSVSMKVGKPPWLYIKPYRGITQTIIIRVDTDLKCVECNRRDSFIAEFFGPKSFTRMQKNVADREHFWQAILNLPFSRADYIKEMITQGYDPLNSFVSPQNLKGNLLMSVEQMASFSYPFPGDRQLDGCIISSEQRPIRATKDKYIAITANSPLFAIDCEMCVSKRGISELTRVTLVDEQCRVLLDTLVKPYEQIVDYVTKYSGITEDMLNPVDVRLEHVQSALSRLLPDDAILVGHSLEYDLRALKLSHPYCIDIALAFNLSGSEKQRSSLKTLTDLFLGETIQDKRGHCSVEDAVATMRLIKMKLQKGFEFGNVSLGWNFDVWARQNGLTTSGARIATIRPYSQISSTGNEDNSEQEQPPRKRKRSGEPTRAERNETTDRDNRLCDECGRAKNVKCSVKDCACVANRTSICVVCCSMKNEPEVSDVPGEHLDWSSALGTSSYIGTKSLIDEVLKTKDKSILCCTHENYCNFESSRRTKFHDSRSFESAEALVETISEELLQHNLAVIELDSELLAKSEEDESSTAKHIDNIVESLVASAPPKSLIALILSSPQESTCRISMKP